MNKKFSKFVAMVVIASFSVGLIACEKPDNRKEQAQNVHQGETIDPAHAAIGEENSGAKNNNAENKVQSIAPFETRDIEGNPYTDRDLLKNKLTMVNVFATWCTPCLQEIPDLEKLNEAMKEKGVGVIGVAVDTRENGQDVPEALDQAKIMKEKLHITYPLLQPDDHLLNGRLETIQLIPETFFVDGEGKIIGDVYSGARSFEEWQTIVEQELENVH